MTCKMSSEVSATKFPRRSHSSSDSFVSQKIHIYDCAQESLLAHNSINVSFSVTLVLLAQAVPSAYLDSAYSVQTQNQHIIHMMATQSKKPSHKVIIETLDDEETAVKAEEPNAADAEQAEESPSENGVTVKSTPLINEEATDDSSNGSLHSYLFAQVALSQARKSRSDLESQLTPAKAREDAAGIEVGHGKDQPQFDLTSAKRALEHAGEDQKPKRRKYYAAGDFGRECLKQWNKALDLVATARNLVRELERAEKGHTGSRREHHSIFNSTSP